MIKEEKLAKDLAEFKLRMESKKEDFIAVKNNLSSVEVHDYLNKLMEQYSKS